MNRDEKYQKVLEGLRGIIQHSADSRSRTRRMRFNAIPFNTDMTFNGVNMADVMVPSVPDDPIQCQAIFDVWAMTLIDRDEDMVAALTRVVAPKEAKSLVDWLAQWETPEAQTSMLLWALGHAEGASVAYDKVSILVEHKGVKYGVERGAILSRFKSGHPLPIENPEALIHFSGTRRTFSFKYIRMYREAYQHSDAAVQVLLALITAHPKADLWGALSRSGKYHTPAPGTLTRWSRVITDFERPLPVIYRQMVPVWMSAPTFRAVIGDVGRSNVMGVETRQAIINRMYQHFYKNKDKK